MNIKEILQNIRDIKKRSEEDIKRITTELSIKDLKAIQSTEESEDD